jgi:hypothetical protein
MEFYLLLLEYALIDIRALQGESKCELGPKLADIFHNVPGALRFRWTEEREGEVYAQMRGKARAYGLDEKLDRWEQHAQHFLEETGSRSRNPIVPPSPAAAP